MKVLIPSALRSYTEHSEAEASGATLAAVLADLDRRYAGIRFRMVDEQDRIRPHIRIFVNGLGQTTPPVIAGQTGSGQRVTAEIVVGVNDAGVRVVSSTYATNLVGIYEVAFEVPAVSFGGQPTQTGPTRPLAVVVVRQNGQFVYGNGSNIAISQ